MFTAFRKLKPINVDIRYGILVAVGSGDFLFCQPDASSQSYSSSEMGSNTTEILGWLSMLKIKIENNNLSSEYKQPMVIVPSTNLETSLTVFGGKTVNV